MSFTDGSNLLLCDFDMLNDRFTQWLRHYPTGSATSTTPEMSVALATDCGLTRTENQDRIAVIRIGASITRKPFMVIALADGMGGMSDGLECAVRTLATFFNSIIKFRNYPSNDMLRLAALEANGAVYAFSKGSGGATLSAVLIENDGPLRTINVGDSRIYARTRAASNFEIVRLTVDDNLEEAIGGVGKELLQFCGMGPGMMPHLGAAPSDTDRLLISSDGVHFIEGFVLHEILMNTEVITETSRQLLTFARWRGSPDNATLAVVDVRKASSELANQGTSSIEIADPFGALELSWLKQELAGPIDQVPPPIEPISDERVPIAPSPPAKRSKSPRGKRKHHDADQLSIEIDSTPFDETNENGSKNDLT